MISYTLSIRTATADISLNKDAFIFSSSLISASFKYRKTEIANLYIDSDSKNTFINDSVSLDDQIQFSFSAALNDSVNMIDSLGFLLSTSFSSSVVASDDLLVSCHYTEPLNDGVVIADSQAFGFTAQLNDSVQVLDNSDFVLTIGAARYVGGAAINEAAIN